MSDDHTQALSDGIRFQAVVPVDWCKIPSLPLDRTQSQTASANLRLLNALNVLEEIPHDLEKSPQALTESSHLDAKLDLILGMLGELLHQQAKIPEVAVVTISSHALSLTELRPPSVPGAGDLLRLRLFLDTRFPQALVLYGSVSTTTETGFSVALHPQGGLVQAQFDKLIFRQHRRAIALSRSASES
ncbi:MAG: PilZ domain-containing protein [Gammaproteobacteria bacterium]|nr:PilZ domain-containing protein [Gammaproteobacteria bacterium]